jgi:ABC-2 type transport system ATP-binding protein
MKPIIAKDIYKDFGKVRALAGVNLELEEGEVYGFIGPNGAGKSTTIRILLGILKATQGSAQIFGKDVWADAVEIHRRIAYVPGDVNLWSGLSGGEVIDLFMRMKGIKGGKYKDELVEKFEFDPTKKCGTYSKGNRQKVALIAAFASDADLYILDEPTSGLDPLMELVFKECVEKVKAEGKTVFLSSHILSEVEQLCDRISIIRQGKVIDTGTLEQLQHLSRNHYKIVTNASLAALESRPGVYDYTSDGHTTEFSIDNDKTPEVVSFLADKDIRHMVCTPPTLEELFLHHYAEA